MASAQNNDNPRPLMDSIPQGNSRGRGRRGNNNYSTSNNFQNGRRGRGSNIRRGSGTSSFNNGGKGRQEQNTSEDASGFEAYTGEQGHYSQQHHNNYTYSYNDPTHPSPFPAVTYSNQPTNSHYYTEPHVGTADDSLYESHGQQIPDRRNPSSYNRRSSNNQYNPRYKNTHSQMQQRNQDFPTHSNNYGQLDQYSHNNLDQDFNHFTQNSGRPEGINSGNAHRRGNARSYQNQRGQNYSINISSNNNSNGRNNGRGNRSFNHRQPACRDTFAEGEGSSQYSHQSDYSASHVSKPGEEESCDGEESVTGRTDCKSKTKLRTKSERPVPANRRETLIDQLSRNAYDCMICCEKVRRHNSIWSCQKCYNVFHLNCVRKWATSSADEIGWRCPGCQTYNDNIPDTYRCFCGNTKNPSSGRQDIPHSCQETCGRTGTRGVECTHPCQLLCHPGPCPPCEVQQTRSCCCGKKNATVICSSKSVITCGNVCDKLLNCEIHRCAKNCHSMSCGDCLEIVKLECHCETETKKIGCTKETFTKPHYSCEKPCGKLLNCSRHRCVDECHSGQCKPCKTSPEAIISCPCGQTSIREACVMNRLPIRKSCLDPIPTCGRKCGKILQCGSPGKQHRCQEPCHRQLECPGCLLVTPVKCRCRNQEFEIPCLEFRAYDDVICEKKCTKKRSCGRHKCNTKCCIDVDHVCPIVCEKPLRCGNHKCSFLCHNGHCPACKVVSFDELSCECGAAVIYPPVPCGTRPPVCDQPCSRIHQCDHPVHHPCHSDANCPPCTFLTQKWCHGKHELRRNILCHINLVSCGMPCQKLLSCGRHKCIRICHPKDCMAPNDVCKLPCLQTREKCGHYCAAPCHELPCPETKCKELTEISCNCGRRKETLVCWKRQSEYDRLVDAAVAKEILELAGKGSEAEELNGEDISIAVKFRRPKENILNCDKECGRLERNRKLALALQLENPDVSTTLGTPNYSEFLLKYVKKYPKFVETVHEKLTEVVMKARKSKKMNETYEFDCMNRDKRHVVHEYSDHFGCQSESFDEEPNRSVIVTASKDKSYLPPVSLIEAAFRPKAEPERRNAHQDVQFLEQMRCNILGPVNRRLTLPSSSGMVPLTGIGSSIETDGNF